MGALVVLASIAYGVYVLIRLVMAFIKKQETNPWLMKLGVAFLVFILSAAGLSSGSPTTSTSTSAPATTTTPVQHRSAEELEQEKARQAALEQRKKEQEKKRIEEQKKRQEWDKRQAEEEKRRKEQETRRKYEARFQQISISSLLNDIRSNAARAKKNYDGKKLKMEGLVLQIDSDGDFIVVSDGPFNILPAVYCYPKKNYGSLKDQMLKINKGEYIMVYGKVLDIGESLGCVLELEEIK